MCFFRSLHSAEADCIFYALDSPGLELVWISKVMCEAPHKIPS